jgi:predicted nucleic acid-binding protein
MPKGSKALVVDANILIGAVLGQRILSVLAKLTNEVKLFTPETSFNDALEHLPKILQGRGEQQGLSNERIEEGIEIALERLNSLRAIVETVEEADYARLRERAIKRLPRDPEDWDLVALALTLNAPIWTKDKDFIGSGIATWTTQTVLLYVEEE